LLLLHWHTWGHVVVVSWWVLLLSTTLSLASLVVVLVWSSVTTLVILSSAHTTTVSLILVEVGAHGLVLLHDVQQLLEDLSHVWVRSQISEVEGTRLLSLIFLEIGLINGVLDLNFSLFLDLVMVDHKSLTIIGGVVQGLLGNSSRVWLLEADESERAISALLQFDVLDGTKLFEEVYEVIRSPGIWEVLDIQVASLL
jgi:hypothetical protein